MDSVYQPAPGVEQLDGPHAVPAVPETFVSLLSIRRLIVHQQHVFLLAGDIRDHPAGAAALLHVPDDLRVGLAAVELRADPRPGLGEVELIGLPLVPESGEKFAGESQVADLRPAAADVEDAVGELLPVISLVRLLEESHTHGEVKSRPQFLSA